MKTTRHSANLLAIACALAAGMSGLARADDSSMGRLGGDSYAYFNRPTAASPAAPSWRQANPQGVSERALEAYSSEALGAELQSNAAPAAQVASDASFRQTHPDGFSERELQALSSETSPWQLRAGTRAGDTAASQAFGAAQAPHETVAQRLAAIFHRGGDDSLTR